MKLEIKQQFVTAYKFIFRCLLQGQEGCQFCRPLPLTEATQSLVISADYPGTPLSHRHYICPLRPSLVPLQLQAGSVHQAIHEKLGSSW